MNANRRIPISREKAVALRFWMEQGYIDGERMLKWMKDAGMLVTLHNAPSVMAYNGECYILEGMRRSCAACRDAGFHCGMADMLL